MHSALAQAGGEPRVIVVDDGSTYPHTLGVLDQLPQRVEVIRQANAGPSEARNAGLRNVQTPYALVLDADDKLAPDALQSMRAVLESEPALGFSYGLVRFFGEWEGIVRMPPYDPYRLLYRHNIGLAALVRRELFEDVGGFDPTFKGYEDWEFWLHALGRGWRGRRVEKVTRLYRRHGSSTLHMKSRPDYRATFRRFRHKHSALYSRAGRRRLAEESSLGAAGRLVYRFWWGWRPLPARLELAAHAILWRERRKTRSAGR